MFNKKIFKSAFKLNSGQTAKYTDEIHVWELHYFPKNWNFGPDLYISATQHSPVWHGFSLLQINTDFTPPQPMTGQ